MTAETLAAALRALPDDMDMTERHEYGGLFYTCCGSTSVHCWPDRRESKHADGCWYVNAKAALAAHEQEQEQS